MIVGYVRVGALALGHVNADYGRVSTLCCEAKCCVLGLSVCLRADETKVQPNGMRHHSNKVHKENRLILFPMLFIVKLVPSRWHLLASRNPVRVW